MTNVLDPVTQIARICHEANRAYCQSIGDNSQQPWDTAPSWQQSSARNGVQAVLDGRIRSPGDSHRSWMAEKEREGWQYGAVKDEVAKTHPCMVRFEDLPPEQRVKDHLFLGVVHAMLDANRGTW